MICTRGSGQSRICRKLSAGLSFRRIRNETDGGHAKVRLALDARKFVANQDVGQEWGGGELRTNVGLSCSGSQKSLKFKDQKIIDCKLAFELANCNL